MRRKLMYLVSTTTAAIALVACSGMTSSPPQSKMSFFVTSVNPGKGADFGGLAGADRYCQTLAASAGAGARTWRAYLSNSALSGSPAMNARDRIGKGPWFNVKGEQIASSVEDLHGPDNKINKQTALTEKGGIVSGNGDAVTLHDMLTGSTSDGRAINDGKDNTCGNWTKSGEGSAIVGHHDRKGTGDPSTTTSWNAAHATRGCGMDALKSTGGGGLLYCFAQN